MPGEGELALELASSSLVESPWYGTKWCTLKMSEVLMTRKLQLVLS